MALQVELQQNIKTVFLDGRIIENIINHKSMGYTTDFKGRFNLDKRLTPEHQNYLSKFCETRRMKRDPDKASALLDPVREAARLPVGDDGGYFVGGGGFAGQGQDESIIDFNKAPGQPIYNYDENWSNNYAREKKMGEEGLCQPGLWCKWTPTEDGTGIEWSGMEKFYSYVPWIKYLISNFLQPWGYTLSGEVSYQGEDPDDFGVIEIKDNVVLNIPGKVLTTN